MSKPIYTPLELIEMITLRDKYYTHAVPQYKAPAAFRIVQAIKAGTCKSKTQNRFFKAFGYDVASEVSYTPAPVKTT